MPALVETMMYVRDVPWHNLGTRLPEEVKSAEAIAAANLDWKVELRDMYFRTEREGGSLLEVPHRKAVVRTTDDSVLGDVGENYHLWQNSEAFEFFDNIVGNGQAIYHTAGSLRGGRQVWILAKLPQTAEVKGVDPVNNYLLLMNGHDGYTALRMLWTPIRVVCWNTLRMAMSRQIGESFYARHTGGLEDRITQAQDMLGFAAIRFDNFIEQANRIANASFLKAELDDFLKEVLEFDPKKGIADQSKNKREAFARIEQLVEVGAGLQIPQISGTKWAVYNAVTEFVDHEKPTRAAAGRLDSAWFGAGAELKDRAWNLLLN